MNLNWSYKLLQSFVTILMFNKQSIPKLASILVLTRHYIHICDSTHQKAPVGSEDQKWVFAVSEMAVHSAQFWWKKVLKLDSAFLRYGNFIEDVIRDSWKVNFEKNALKIWDSVLSIGILVIRESTLIWKHCFHTKPFKKLKYNVLKIPKYVKSQNWLWDYILRYFDCATPILKI